MSDVIFFSVLVPDSDSDSLSIICSLCSSSLFFDVVVVLLLVRHFLLISLSNEVFHRSDIEVIGGLFVLLPVQRVFILVIHLVDCVAGLLSSRFLLGASFDIISLIVFVDAAILKVVSRIGGDDWFAFRLGRFSFCHGEFLGVSDGLLYCEFNRYILVLKNFPISESPNAINNFCEHN